MNGTDRETDRETHRQQRDGQIDWTSHRYIDPASHTMQAVSIYLFRKCCSRCRFQPYDCVIIHFVK